MIAAVGLNFIGVNPMRALVFAGIVQGFSTPPLMLLIMLMTNSPFIMGDKRNSLLINLFGLVHDSGHLRSFTCTTVELDSLENRIDFRRSAIVTGCLTQWLRGFYGPESLSDKS